MSAILELLNDPNLRYVSFIMDERKAYITIDCYDNTYTTAPEGDYGYQGVKRPWEIPSPLVAKLQSLHNKFNNRG
jgi:hypothetical protein